MEQKYTQALKILTNQGISDRHRKQRHSDPNTSGEVPLSPTSRFGATIKPKKTRGRFIDESSETVAANEELDKASTQGHM